MELEGAPRWQGRRHANGKRQAGGQVGQRGTNMEGKRKEHRAPSSAFSSEFLSQILSNCDSGEAAERSNGLHIIGCLRWQREKEGWSGSIMIELSGVQMTVWL